MPYTFTCFWEVTSARGGGEQRLTVVSHSSSTQRPDSSHTQGDRGTGLCWGPHAGPLMEHQGRTADPATTQPCCQNRLCPSYTSFLGVEMCLNHGGKYHAFSSAACPLDVFCLITLSNHFLLSLGCLHSFSLNHRRVFEMSSAPPSALYMLSGRGHGVQH